MDRASNPVPIVREVADLKALAAAINAATEAGDEATSKGLDYYREAGEKLLKAKQACGHGNWQQWCKQNVHCSIRQARRYMALAKCDGSADLADQWRVILNGDEQPEEAEAKTAVNGRFESPKEETVKAKSQPKSEPAGPGTRPPVATGERQPGDDDPGAAGATTPTAPEPKSPGGAERRSLAEEYAAAEADPNPNRGVPENPPDPTQGHNEFERRKALHADDPTYAPEAPAPPAAPPLLDRIGVRIPPEMAAVFDPAHEVKRQRVLSLCRQLRDAVHEYAVTPAADYFRRDLKRVGKEAGQVRYRFDPVGDLMAMLDDLAPHCCLCPYCSGRTGTIKHDCPSCNGRGWSPAKLFARDGAPRDYVAACKSRAEKGDAA